MITTYKTDYDYMRDIVNLMLRDYVNNLDADISEVVDIDCVDILTYDSYILKGKIDDLENELLEFKDDDIQTEAICEEITEMENLVECLAHARHFIKDCIEELLIDSVMENKGKYIELLIENLREE